MSRTRAHVMLMRDQVAGLMLMSYHIIQEQTEDIAGANRGQTGHRLGGKRGAGEG
jgi:hypothetical protein